MKNRKCSGYVDGLQAGSIDQNLFFSKLKLLVLRQWWQLWIKSTAIKQRYRKNLFFAVFCLIVLLPNLRSKLIHNQCKLTCKLLIKTIDAYMYANDQLGPCFYVLVHYSLLFSSEVILKHLFASGLVNIVEELLNINCLLRDTQPANKWLWTDTCIWTDCQPMHWITLTMVCMIQAWYNVLLLTCLS